MAKRRDVGAWGEAIAVKHLAQLGYTLRERNWRYGHGELDIVAQHGDKIIFIEVRTRRSDAYGRPQETISARKRAKLIATAQAYLDAHGLQDAQWQIDVIAIELNERNIASQIEHIECAIEG